MNIYSEGARCATCQLQSYINRGTVIRRSFFYNGEEIIGASLANLTMLNIENKREKCRALSNSDAARA